MKRKPVEMTFLPRFSMPALSPSLLVPLQLGVGNEIDVPSFVPSASAAWPRGGILRRRVVVVSKFRFTSCFFSLLSLVNPFLPMIPR